jgi:arginine exporter protein ArgO
MIRAEIYHFTMSSSGTSGFSKLKPAVIVINAALSAIFLVLLILFLTLVNPQIQVDCTTLLDNLDQYTATEGIAIAYKVFFALVCVTLSILFVLYGVRILHLMRNNSATNGKDAAKQSRRKHAIMRVRSAAKSNIDILSACADCLLPAGDRICRLSLLPVGSSRKSPP